MCMVMNICRTCSTFAEFGGFCSALLTFLNVIVVEYGMILGEKEIMVEIFVCGFVFVGIDVDGL